MLNSVDSDQAQHFVGSDVGPNCFQTRLVNTELKLNFDQLL